RFAGGGQHDLHVRRQKACALERIACLQQYVTCVNDSSPSDIDRTPALPHCVPPIRSAAQSRSTRISRSIRSMGCNLLESHGSLMSQHIGIVACSAEGAALCYLTICVEGPPRAGRHGHPEVSMHTFSLAQYMAPIYRGDWAAVGSLMLAGSEEH